MGLMTTQTTPETKAKSAPLFDAETRLSVVSAEQIPRVEPSKAALGQVMTPPHVALFMASLFSDVAPERIRLLDAGAGRGSLSGAMLNRFGSTDRVKGAAVEIDPLLIPELSAQLAHSGMELHNDDFILWAVALIQAEQRPFTHAILNPPYRKIKSAERYKGILRKVGIESVNLYSAFVSLALELMKDGGELVAILPRSFCNGPYYRAFRQHVLENSSLDHIHLFDSRTSTFKSDGVLQENVILKLTRNADQAEVTISHSSDDQLSDYQARQAEFARVVPQQKGQRFIHISVDDEPSQLESLRSVDHSLEELGLKVSTGPVVDFRVREHLRQEPQGSDVPLIYPNHFSGLSIEWPQAGSKKPNAIADNQVTAKQLYESGIYCAVRRMSSKEEKRRVVASVVDASAISSAARIGFENHVNVFHAGKRGLSREIAYGLAVFLNSSIVDEHFRRFNGHTQVNVTDLRHLQYPSLEKLERLGSVAIEQQAGQEHVDELTKSLLS
ncbi:MAG: Eco57I restriction-modification methylase domain-containing protein [Rubricoccaceae bacterium]